LYSYARSIQVQRPWRIFRFLPLLVVALTKLAMALKEGSWGYSFLSFKMIAQVPLGSLVSAPTANIGKHEIKGWKFKP